LAVTAFALCCNIGISFHRKFGGIFANAGFNRFYPFVNPPAARIMVLIFPSLADKCIMKPTVTATGQPVVKI